MLRGDDDRPDALGHAALVLDRDLGLAVGAEVRQLAGLADLGEAARHPMGEGDRQRHQLRRLAAGEPEHHPLVAGTELVRGRIVADLERRVDALGDVRRLALDRDQRAAGLVVEAVVGSGIADVADGVADDLLEVDVGVRRDLAEDDHEAGRRRRLAGDAGVRIVADDRVEDGVRDLVAHLVGMAFGDRFGGEQVLRASTMLVIKILWTAVIGPPATLAEARVARGPDRPATRLRGWPPTPPPSPPSTRPSSTPPTRSRRSAAGSSSRTRTSSISTATRSDGRHWPPWSGWLGSPPRNGPAS